jgi:hypothetical protein
VDCANDGCNPISWLKPPTDAGPSVLQVQPSGQYELRRVLRDSQIQCVIESGDASIVLNILFNEDESALFTIASAVPLQMKLLRE